MNFELVLIQCHKIMQAPSYTAFVLGTEEKRFALYTSPHIGKNIHTHLAPQTPLRPNTYDLVNSILGGFNINIIQVVITNIHDDTIYFARLLVEQIIDKQRTILEIDSRPSDCLSLAIENNIPIYCTTDVLDRAIAVEE